MAGVYLSGENQKVKTNKNTVALCGERTLENFKQGLYFVFFVSLICLCDFWDSRMKAGSSAR